MTRSCERQVYEEKTNGIMIIATILLSESHTAWGQLTNGMGCFSRLVNIPELWHGAMWRLILARARQWERILL